MQRSPRSIFSQQKQQRWRRHRRRLSSTLCYQSFSFRSALTSLHIHFMVLRRKDDNATRCHGCIIFRFYFHEFFSLLCSQLRIKQRETRVLKDEMCNKEPPQYASMLFDGWSKASGGTEVRIWWNIIMHGALFYARGDNMRHWQALTVCQWKCVL